MKIPGAAISHQIIREQCRQNHGAAGAFKAEAAAIPPPPPPART